MLAIGELTLQQFFAQLYAHTDIEAEPASAGRLMNGPFWHEDARRKWYVEEVGTREKCHF